MLNLAASIQDVATDSLAIDILSNEEDLALGNAAQVVGFKIGMILSGGLVPWIFSQNPRIGCFGMIGIIDVGAAILLALYNEKAQSLAVKDENKLIVSKRTFSQNLYAVYSGINHTLHQPSMRALLLLLFSYKAGEVMADAMFKPFLLDEGVDAESVSLWTGVIGSAFSIVGSIAGNTLFHAKKWSKG